MRLGRGLSRGSGVGTGCAWICVNNPDGGSWTNNDLRYDNASVTEMKKREGGALG